MKRVSIGGQAVIEGVMMKNADKYAIAVRKPDNDIEVKVERCKSAGDKCKIFKMPIIRGVVNFIESMIIGVKTLTYSAEFFEEDEPKKESKKEPKKSSKTADNFFMGITVFISLVLAVGLFMLLPALIVSLLGKSITNSFVVSLIEGIIRLVIFLLYVWGISQMKDIKRTFMYHGAEHKTINCLEDGYDLTVENVREHSRFHKRCGTSFLFVVMIVSIVVFMFITTNVVWQRLLFRVLLVPVVAGVSYEFIRYAGRSDSKIAYALSVPGMWIQKMTTKEPTDDMIEVAIKSVEGVFDWQLYVEAIRNNDISK